MKGKQQNNKVTGLKEQKENNNYTRSQVAQPNSWGVKQLPTLFVHWNHQQ